MYYDNRFDQNYINYCILEAEKMYPELYRKVYPHVRGICERDDNAANQAMHPFPKQEVVDKMVDEIYENIRMDNIGMENMQRTPLGYGYGPINILRAFIAALLLRELVDRRRFYHRRRPWFYY